MLGTRAGDLQILTERPWVEISGCRRRRPCRGTRPRSNSLRRAAPDALPGCDDRHRRGRSGFGTVSAGESTMASFVVGGGFVEGGNALRLVVEDDDGDRGHDESTLTVDNPPGAVALGRGACPSETRAVRFVSRPRGCRCHRVHGVVSASSFSRAAWASCPDGTSPCGPAFDGDDAVDAPFPFLQTRGRMWNSRSSRSPWSDLLHCRPGHGCRRPGGAMSRVRSGTP